MAAHEAAHVSSLRWRGECVIYQSLVLSIAVIHQDGLYLAPALISIDH